MDISPQGILKFLHRFGWLDGSIQTWDEGAMKAMVAYMQYFGIPIASGSSVSEAFMAHLCQRRCARPDRGPQAVVQKWNKNLLRWKFVNYTLDIPQHEISGSFNKGFGVWSEHIPLDFQEVMADEQADIQITFKKLDTVGNVLAQAWFPPVGKMEFDESELWSWKLPINRGQVDLATVVAHEAGHVLGLEHSNVRGSQMAPVYAGPMRFLTQDDIARAQAIYGSR